MSLLELFCHVDDFWLSFAPHWEQELLRSGVKQRRRAGNLHPSEMMTIVIFFHHMRYRDFKTYYTQFVQVYLRAEFPHLVSYNRFVELMPSILVPLCAYLRHCYGECSGVSFIDSTPITVCHNRRIAAHRVFRGIAQRGKNSVGWFFGFKLHLVANDRGELLACRLTAANVDDRTPVPHLTRWLWGKLFGDKGYLSQPLTEQLRQRGIRLITRLKSNMKNRLVLLCDKLLLRKRSIVETITDQLKNISQIEHSRHRSLANFMVNLVCGLIAYCHQPKKPSLALDLPQLEVLIPN
jgi:DDE family transposase